MALDFNFAYSSQEALSPGLDLLSTVSATISSQNAFEAMDFLESKDTQEIFRRCSSQENKNKRAVRYGSCSQQSALQTPDMSQALQLGHLYDSFNSNEKAHLYLNPPQYSPPLIDCNHNEILPHEKSKKKPPSQGRSRNSTSAKSRPPSQGFSCKQEPDPIVHVKPDPDSLPSDKDTNLSSYLNINSVLHKSPANYATFQSQPSATNKKRRSVKTANAPMNLSTKRIRTSSVCSSLYENSETSSFDDLDHQSDVSSNGGTTDSVRIHASEFFTLKTKDAKLANLKGHGKSSPSGSSSHSSSALLSPRRRTSSTSSKGSLNEEEKKLDKKERNRLAARKLREKRKEEKKKNEQSIEYWEKKVAANKKIVDELTREKEHFQNLLFSSNKVVLNQTKFKDFMQKIMSIKSED